MTNELYRQTVHLVTGILAATSAFFLAQHVFFLFWTTIFAGSLCVIIGRPRFFTPLWRVFERSDAAFKGKGWLFFLLGILATGALFWERAAPALFLLAIPDALATMLAPLVPSQRLPWNHRKGYFGSGVFFVSAFLVLLVTVPFVAAVLLALLLTAIESFDYREIPFLDDNLVIPLVAAFFLGFV